MRRRRSAAAVVAGLIVVLLGQRAAAQTVSIRAGIASSNVTETPHVAGDTLQRETGVVAGVSVAFPVRTHIALQAEALFSQKGNRLLNEAAAIDSTLTLDYLEIPVLANLDVVRHSAVRIGVTVGPTFAFLLRSEEQGFGQPLPEEEQIRIGNMDVGIAVGAEAEYGRFLAGARYTHGLSNIFNDDPVSYGVDALRNRAFAIYGGWLLTRRR